LLSSTPIRILVAQCLSASIPSFVVSVSPLTTTTWFEASRASSLRALPLVPGTSYPSIALRNSSYINSSAGAIARVGTLARTADSRGGFPVAAAVAAVGSSIVGAVAALSFPAGAAVAMVFAGAAGASWPDTKSRVFEAIASMPLTKDEKIPAPSTSAVWTTEP